MSKILIVEDEHDLASQLKEWFSEENYLVDTCSSGLDALDILAVYRYDVIILDWMLPGASGLDVIKHFRKRGGNTPVLMLTAKVSFEHRAHGLDSGADDYLSKPFNMTELAARIRALIRRGALTQAPENVYKIDNLTLCSSGRTVHINEMPIHLEPKEFNLLEFLIRNAGKTFSSEALHVRVWESMTQTSVDTVRTYIRNIRKKIDEAGGPQSLITTVHGCGYRVDLS